MKVREESLRQQVVALREGNQAKFTEAAQKWNAAEEMVRGR
jgi:hypothetical protein